MLVINIKKRYFSEPAWKRMIGLFATIGFKKPDSDKTLSLSLKNPKTNARVSRALQAATNLFATAPIGVGAVAKDATEQLGVNHASLSAPDMLKAVTLILVAALRSKASGPARRADIFTKFEERLVTTKSNEELVSAFIRMEAICLYRFFGGGYSRPMPVGLCQSELGGEAPGASLARSNKSQLIFTPRKPVTNFQGFINQDRILMLQLPVSMIHLDKLYQMLNSRRKKGDFYMRAADSESLLKHRLQKAYRAGLQKSLDNGFGIVLVTVALEKGISCKSIIDELVKSGALKGELDSVLVGFNATSLIRSTRFCEVKNIGSKKRRVYQRLDNLELINPAPIVMAVANKII